MFDFIIKKILFFFIKLYSIWIDVTRFFYSNAALQQKSFEVNKNRKFDFGYYLHHSIKIIY